MILLFRDFVQLVRRVCTYDYLTQTIRRRIKCKIKCRQRSYRDLDEVELSEFERRDIERQKQLKDIRDEMLL